MAQRSLASVRRHVFVCSEVCDGGALRLGPEFQNSSRSGIRSRLFFRERGRGRSGSFGFLQWQAFSSKRESVSWTAEHHRNMPLKYVDEKTRKLYYVDLCSGGQVRMDAPR